MSKNDSKLLTKVSSLIPGQLPEFVESDHSLFVKFLKDYYQFLEAGRITLSTTINYIQLETTTVSYVLDETDGERIVTEIGEGTLGQFVEGETITGGTSNATATVLVDDTRNKYIYVTSQQKFVTGEVITGATSGSTATVSEYRANPVQNIQQLLEYANVDNTIFDFLEQFRKSFMNAIPSTLASGVSKRNLIKNIKDLYAAKGTSEATKLFMKIFLGEEPSILYPNQFMMKVSDGNFGQQTILRTAPDFGVLGDEVVNQLITGVTSGASATVESAVTVVQGGQSISELRLASPVGTFIDGERATANSTTRDVSVGFTVRGIVSDATVVNDGILHSNNETLTVEAIGNQSAEVVVNKIKLGSISGVEVDDVGSKYEVGDTLTFTPVSADTDRTVSASGFVSMVGGGIQLESGTLDDLSLTDDSLILESGSTTHLEPFSIALETIESDTFFGDGDTTVFSLTNVNASNDNNVIVRVNNGKVETTTRTGDTFYSLVGQTLTFTTAPIDNALITVTAESTDSLVLDGTDSSSTDAGHQIITEIGLDFEQLDTHRTDNDQIVLEFGTFSASEAGAIQKVHVSNGGKGYSDLPNVTITTTTGTGASLLAVTDDIGAIDSLSVDDSGFNYTSSNPPDLTARAHFVLKDVTGTFENTNTLTTHVGTVKSFNSDTNILETTFENVVRVEQEQDGTFNEGIELEDGTVVSDNTIVEGIQLEDEQDIETEEDDNIVLEGTEIVTPSAKFIRHIVKVVRTAAGNNVYQIDGVVQPTLRFTEGDTHYFDLSHSSLYNTVSTNAHVFQLSTTSDGTHGSGTEYTTGVTKSASYVEAGTTGAFLQIVVASGTAPNPLFYYCKNHSGMGGRIETREVVSFVKDENSNLLLDGSAVSISNLVLEDSLGNGFIRYETTVTRDSQIILEDELNSTGNFSILLEDGNQLLTEDVFNLFFGFQSNLDGRVDITTSTDFGGSVLLEVSSFQQQERAIEQLGRNRTIQTRFPPSIAALGCQPLIGDDDIFRISSPEITGTPSFIQDVGGKVLIDRVREVDLNGKLLLDGINSDGLGENEQLATENAGRSIILDGTDADGTDGASKLLFEDETGDGDVVLDGTDSDSTDAGDNIINESPIDFSNKNVTITDSSGASGTIVKADIATATSTVRTTATTVGAYSGIRSLLGEDLNRIQDSLYYQDYSYEVQVGAAFSDYVNELKKSVHPAGFRPFGKVSIANLVSVAVTNTGTGVQSFIGDGRFSPILASTFETIFDQNILTRMGSQKYEIGSFDDQIIFEDGVIGGDKLVLDASSSSTGSTTPSDVSIILEDSLQPSGYGYDTAYIILDSSAAGFADEGGKLDLESGSFEDEFENILLEDNSTISHW